MALLAGLDLGTTGSRCILFDEQLNVIGDAYYEYPLINLPPDFVEQDAELWWVLLCRAIKEAAVNGGADLHDVVAVSISSQGITMVPVDSSLHPLCNAINWLDRRKGTEGSEIIDAIGSREYTTITARLSPLAYGLSKILWFKKNRPDIYNRTSRFLMPMDFIIGKLCGNIVTDHSMAAGMGCYDMAGRCWSDKILEAVGVSKSLLAEIKQSGHIAGYVTNKAAAECGLAEGTIVAIGAQDQKCGGGRGRA